MHYREWELLRRLKNIQVNNYQLLKGNTRDDGLSSKNSIPLK